MAIVSLRGISIAFGGAALLENVDLHIEPKERVCLLGRNGAGKSTLLKIAAGLIPPDAGVVDRAQGADIAYLDQSVPEAGSGTVRDVVETGFSPNFQAEQWEKSQAVDIALGRLGLEGDEPFSTLSGGTKRRAMLVRALVGKPDLLLLDEPTNHLDIPTIEKLESDLKSYDGAILFVSHDRALTKNIATRIAELDRGEVLSFDCGYEKYLERRDDVFAALDQQKARLEKKIEQETAWAKKGMKARRRRNQGRLRALQKLREDYRSQRSAVGDATFRIEHAKRSGKLVVRAQNIALAYEGAPLVSGLDFTAIRGDKVGIIGPNGCGKTTLLRALLGELEPNSGSVEHGVSLEIAYMDQLREQLDLDATVADNVCDGNDTVTVGDSKRHVISYLQDFLFAPERAHSPARVLSGGEKNKLLLARLFARPSNVLVLDEPTNDLDMETLELLEDLIVSYAGTVFLVSHDRDFLNNTVTSTLVFESDAKLTAYAGGYDDWLSQRPDEAGRARREKKKKAQMRPEKAKPRKLTYKETMELEALPDKIASAEEERDRLRASLADPQFYQSEKETIAQTVASLETSELTVAELYDRWTELEAIKEQSEK